MSIRITTAYEGDRETVILANAIDAAIVTIGDMLSWTRLSERSRLRLQKMRDDLESAITAALFEPDFEEVEENPNAE